jgi:membrane protease YdiL (CAAX protease family)
MLFVIGALLLLDLLDLRTWALAVTAAAAILALASSPAQPHRGHAFDARDLRAVAILYVAIVGLFRLAFEVFTTDSLIGLFLAFATGLVLGVVGPIVYQVWGRGRTLESLGIGGHHLRETIALGVVLAGVQFSVTMWGYDLPSPEDWVPLLLMSLTVGIFEAVFFRGFAQNCLEASFGTAPGIAAAAALYALYHIGYGMGIDQMVFLFGLGVVYAIAFALTRNVLVLWPLLTPLGAFFNNLEAGDIELPWASVAGFTDVAAVMGFAIWVGYRKSSGGRVFRARLRDRIAR